MLLVQCGCTKASDGCMAKRWATFRGLGLLCKHSGLLGEHAEWDPWLCVTWGRVIVLRGNVRGTGRFALPSEVSHCPNAYM